MGMSPTVGVSIGDNVFEGCCRISPQGDHLRAFALLSSSLLAYII